MVRRLLIILIILGVVGYFGWQFLSQPSYWLYSLDAATGKVLWSTNLPTSKRSTSIPYTANGRVYVGLITSTDDANERSVSLNAFDAQTGQQLWEFVPDPEQFRDGSRWITQRPYALGDLAFMTVYETDESSVPVLLAIDANTGKLRWSLDHTYESEQGSIPEVAMVGGKLIVLQWRNVNDKVTYFARVVDPQTGKILQDLLTWDPDDWGSFLPFYDPFLQALDDTLFLLTDKAIYAFDAATGTRKFAITVASARYAISNDGIFMRQKDTVSGYDLRTGEQRWTYYADSFQQTHNYFNWITASYGTVQVMCSCVGGDARDGTTLYVFDAQTGALRFSQLTSSDYMDTYFLRAAAAENIVLAPIGWHSRHAELSGIAALDAKDGNLRWQFVTAPTRLKSPASDGSHIFVTAYDTRLRALLTPMNSEWRFSVGLESP